MLLKKFSVRNFYGGKYGFLNGIGLGIMLENCFGRFKPKSAFDLLGHFFDQYSNWDWDNPITMTEYPPMYPLSLETERNVIKILTPEKYQQNAARTVLNKTLQKIKKELLFGAQSIKMIINKDRPLPFLFEKSCFYGIYNGYLIFRIYDNFSRFTEYIESRVMKMLQVLNEFDDISFEALGRFIDTGNVQLLIIGFNWLTIDVIADCANKFAKRTMISAVSYIFSNI
jgi:poly(A) polymerase Pap1